MSDNVVKSVTKDKYVKVRKARCWATRLLWASAIVLLLLAIYEISYDIKNIVPIKLYSEGEFMFIHKPIYDVDEKRVEFFIEKLAEIDITPFLALNDIESKRELTNKIAKSLYN